MLIWRGWGLLVIVIVVGMVLLGGYVTDSITGGSEYRDTHSWPYALSLLPPAAVLWFLGRFLANRKARSVIDEETGERLVLRSDHSLFFVKMHWWGPILVVVALGNIIYELVQ